MVLISDIRREYGQHALTESSLPDDPFILFNTWFDEVLALDDIDPTAMVLATVDKNGHPDTRVVLLKGLENQQFIFYTNYASAKAQQIKHQAYAALNFYWPPLARQVRVRGHVVKISSEQSDAYFATRPMASQCSAIVSKQSQPIAGRDDLEKNAIELMNSQEKIVRPDYWGGYSLLPDELEFWQGRDNRLHDRIQYILNGKKWMHRRLAP